MARRKKNVLSSSGDDSEAGSQSADSVSTVNNSRPAPKTKATARKRGRPPAANKKKAQKILDSDDDGSSPNSPQNNNQSEDENDSSDSDYTVDNSRPTPKTKATARKRGRPPATTRKKVQNTQDDSDAGGSSRSNTPQNVNNDRSEDEDNSSDSDYVADSTNKPKRKPRRPPLTANNKKQKLQNATLRDSSPQPSTSYQTQNGIDQSEEESENDSDSNSADSDFGVFNERSLVKKKTTGKQQPQKTAKKIPTNTGNSNSNKPSVNTSQLNGSHKKSSQNAKLSQSYDPLLDSDVIERLAHELIYFLLIEDQKKYAIRRKGIVTHVFKEDYTPKRYAAVMKRANVLLKKIYGMEIMELENQKDSYLIVNLLRRELGIHEYVEISRTKQQQHGLILYLLTAIYMNENVITEDELTRCLKPLGIDLTSKRLHPVFGDVKKYITTELVKQMYLNYECLSKEPPKYEFTWGLRAKQEFDKRDLLQFACQIIDDTSPEDWRIQFRDAESSARPNPDS